MSEHSWGSGKMIPANDPGFTIPETNRRLKEVTDLLDRVGQVLGRLVDLAQLEREERLAAEALARRRHRQMLVLGVMTLAVAIAAVVVAVLVG
jgi:hypothetical protein